MDHSPTPSAQIGRRSFLAAGLGGAALVTLPAWPAGSAVASAPAPAPSPVYESHPATEPSGTHVRAVDGTGALFAYGEVVPSFDGWRTREPERDYLDLTGRWRFRADPDGSGLARGWQRPDHDDRDWSSIGVPAAWDLQDTPRFGSLDGSGFGTGTAFLDGYAWYRRTVHLPAARPGRHVRLNFLAVGYSADVWLDGEYLGKHEGASTPFSLPIPASVRPDRPRTLAVRVYRRASFTAYTGPATAVTDDREIPYKPVDYWPYAGITRPVWLEAVAETSIDRILIASTGDRLDMRVVVANRGTDRLLGAITLDPDPASGAAPVSVPVELPAGAVTVVQFDVPVPGAPRWSPQRPTVLTARATLTASHGATCHPVDGLSARYGIRDLRVEGSRLELDGRPLFLKGTSWHEETAAHGRAMTLAEYDTELGRVRDLGANFIRNCVYGRHPYVYDWADAHGVLVMDEFDTMWLNTAQEKLQTQEYGLARAMALSMAWNRHNNPSVILWGLQNESEIDGGGAPVYRAWLADMKAAVRAVDLTARPVTWASSTTWDPAFDIADVIGFNEYFGYFYGRSADLGPAIDAVHQAHPDKPILITENGTWAIAGQHGAADVQGNEEWQAQYIADHWNQAAARTDYVTGYTLWVLKDYKERDGYNQSYNGVSVLGLLTFDDETPKLAYDTFRTLRV